MTAYEFEQKIASGEAQVLTLAAAKQLKGKRIRWFYLGDPSNVNSVRQMEVGPLISEWEYASRQPFEGYSSKADYWRSYMSARRIEELKQTLLLLDAQGNVPYLRVHLYTDVFEEPTFTCSDIDRKVYYLLEEGDAEQVADRNAGC